MPVVININILISNREFDILVGKSGNMNKWYVHELTLQHTGVNIFPVWEGKGNFMDIWSTGPTKALEQTHGIQFHHHKQHKNC